MYYDKIDSYIVTISNLLRIVELHNIDMNCENMLTYIHKLCTVDTKSNDHNKVITDYIDHYLTTVIMIGYNVLYSL